MFNPGQVITKKLASTGSEWSLEQHIEKLQKLGASQCHYKAGKSQDITFK